MTNDFWTVDYPRAQAAARAEIERMKVDRNEGYQLVGWSERYKKAVYLKSMNLTNNRFKSAAFRATFNVTHEFDIDSQEALSLVAGEMLKLSGKS